MNVIQHLTWPELLVRLTPFSVAAAALIGLLRFRHLPLNLRYLTGLLSFVLPMNLVGFVLLLQHRSNLFLMPFYAVGELWLLALVYKHTLQSAAFTRLLPWLVGGFAAYAAYDSLLTDTTNQFRPGQQVIQSVLVLGMVALYFRTLLTELRVQQLRREPMFWVSTGLFVYFAGYLQIAIFSNYLFQYSEQLNLNVWAIHSLLFLVLYLCYCVALWLPPQK